MAPSNVNVAALNVPYFTPAQNPPAGTALDPQPDGKPIPTLFKPIKIRGLELQNRIFLSPLCQYSSKDGFLQPWHDAHLGGIFTRGPGLTFFEATAVLPEGRIAPEDAGIWSDAHIAPFQRITEFAHSQGQKVAIQLAHAGRKASTVAAWVGGERLASAEIGGWPNDTVAPSAIPYAPGYPHPKELTKEGIKNVINAFQDAAIRALKAGIDVIEVHSAHGYLLSEFLSPHSNKRTDEYGGSFENRTRLTLEVVDAIRAVIPQAMPLFLRISATEWLEDSGEPSWTSEDTVRLAPILYSHGVDFLVTSTAGNSPAQKITRRGPAYQSGFAEDVKRSLPAGHGLLVGAVGSIINGRVAQEVLDKGQADAVLVGRMFQKNPGLVWSFADDLGVQIRKANQIGWGFDGRGAMLLGK